MELSSPEIFPNESTSDSVVSTTSFKRLLSQLWLAYEEVCARNLMLEHQLHVKHGCGEGPVQCKPKVEIHDSADRLVDPLSLAQEQLSSARREVARLEAEKVAASQSQNVKPERTAGAYVQLDVEKAAARQSQNVNREGTQDQVDKEHASEKPRDSQKSEKLEEFKDPDNSHNRGSAGYTIADLDDQVYSGPLDLDGWSEHSSETQDWQIDHSNKTQKTKFQSVLSRYPTAWLYTDDKLPLNNDEAFALIFAEDVLKDVKNQRAAATSWMCSPFNPWRLRWEFLVLSLIIFQLVVVPFELVFLDEYLMATYSAWFVIEILLILVFLVDMVLNFRTGLVERGVVQYDVKKVAWSYVSTWFAVDFLAWLPSVLALVSLSEKDPGRSTAMARFGRSIKFSRIMRISRLLQIVRVIRLRQAANKLQLRFQRSSMITSLQQIGTAIFASAMCMHLVACLWAGAALGDHLTDQGLAEEDSLAPKYFLALWWSSCSLTLGGEPSPRSTAERILAVVVNVANVVSVGTAFAWLVHITRDDKQGQKALMANMKIASRFIAENKLPKQLALEIHHAIRISANNNQIKLDFKESVEKYLGESLLQRVYGCIYGNCLRRFPPFAEDANELYPGCTAVPDRFLWRLAYEAKLITAIAGDHVATIGSKAETMVFILEGSLLLLLAQPVVIPEGGWFGEKVLIYDQLARSNGTFGWSSRTSTRSASILALEASKLLAISEDSFKEAVKFFDLKSRWLTHITRHISTHKRTLGCSCCGEVDHWIVKCPHAIANPQVSLQDAARQEMKILADSRPSWLPSTGPGNNNVEPDMWGMTLRQFAATIMACYFTPKWGELEASIDRKDQGYVNFYQVNEHMVKPWTKNTGNSIALLLNNQKPLKADVMISHAWGESILETLNAIIGKASVIGMTLDTTIWFCTFALYQPGDIDDCGPNIEDQVKREPFKRVIEAAPRYGVLVVHTSTAELYGRLWCVFEVNEALMSNVVTTSAYSMQALEHLTQIEETGSDLEKALKVDTSKAECFSQEDDLMIRQKILDTYGFEELNKEILQFRLASVTTFREMFKGFAHWAGLAGAQEEAFNNLKVVVCRAAMFVGIHCLLTYVEAVGDDPMAWKMVDMAIETMDLWAAAIARCNTAPPGLDTSLPDRSNKALIRQDLKDLRKFPFAIGLLELSAGGSTVAQIKQHAVPSVQDAFKQWTHGSMKMTRENFRSIVRMVNKTCPEHEMNVMFSVVDSDHDGIVTLPDFYTWLHARFR